MQSRATFWRSRASEGVLQSRAEMDNRNGVDDEDYLLTSLAASDEKQRQLAPTQQVNVNFDDEVTGNDVVDCLTIPPSPGVPYAPGTCDFEMSVRRD